MEIANPGLAFNKAVFKGLNPDNRAGFRTKTNAMHNALFRLSLNPDMVAMLDVKNFIDLSREGKDCHGRFLKQQPLIVAWPGLMMGLGYGHGAKTTTKDEKTNHPFETEVKTGFYFDFTTGLPVLPGSTVKGILRSFFPGRYKGSKALKEGVGRRIKDILKSLLNKDFSDEQVMQLEEVIFEGKENGKSIPSTEQDIFFDAFPCNGTTAKIFKTNAPEEKQNLFLGEDVLTPHQHPLKDPVPLKHLKILPGVKIKFQFLLNDKGGLSTQEKEILFTHLLREFGAGARKGTGFGQFEPESRLDNPFTGNGFILFDTLNTMGWEDEAFNDYNKPGKFKKPIPASQPSAKLVEDSSWPEMNSLKIGSPVKGTIISTNSGSLTVQLHVKGAIVIINIQGKGEVNDVLNLKVNETSGKPEKGNYNITKVVKQN